MATDTIPRLRDTQYDLIRKVALSLSRMTTTPGGGDVPSTRSISTTGPLQGGGDLSADRVLSILQAGAGQSGFLTAADWSTFNSKIGGSGTAGRLAKFTAGTTLGDSLLSESGDEITLNSGRLIVNRGTIVASSPAIDVSSTWNNAAVTFTGLRYNVTDTASNAASLLMDLQVGGSSLARIAKSGSGYFSVGVINSQAVFAGGAAGESAAIGSGSGGGTSRDLRIWNGTTSSNYIGTVGFVTGSGRSINWTSGTDPYASSVDLSLFRDAANTLGLRNSTNAQTFNIYNTYTSSTNHERGFLSWVSNEFRIGTEKGSGGGSVRDLAFYIDGTRHGFLTTYGGRFYFAVNQQGYLGFHTRCYASSPADGVLLLQNNGLTDFNRLQFGLTTSAAPALKRSSATLQCRLADDSDFAEFASKREVLTQGTLTGASSPIIDATTTWNDAAVTFTGLRYNVTDTASNAASLLMDLQVGGSSRFNVRKDGRVTVQGRCIVNGSGGSNDPAISMGQNLYVGWSSVSGNATYGSEAVRLYQDASGALAQRNSTNAQSFRVYNTYTSSTNYERGVFDWQTTANTLRIGTEKGSGGGTARDLVLVTDGTAALTISTGQVATFASDLIIPNGSKFQFGTLRSRIYSVANSTIILTNAAQSDFDRLQLGGTTSSFPALKRSTTTLQARLADDSDFADFSCEQIRTNNGVFHVSDVALTDGAAAQTGTLTNAPAAGNPTKWIPINDNGTTRYIPCW